MCGTTPWSTRSPWRWRSRSRRRPRRPGRRGSWPPACPGWSCCCGTGPWTPAGAAGRRGLRGAVGRGRRQGRGAAVPELTSRRARPTPRSSRSPPRSPPAVDPGLAERRRKAAEKHRLAGARCSASGPARPALSGRDLPTDQTLAAFANVNARARQYKDSGAFPGERIDRLRATAYLDILNGFTADDRIAYGRLSPDDPDPDPDADAGARGSPRRRRPRRRPGPGRARPPAGDDGPGLGGSDCPCRECDGRCAPPDDDGDPDDDDPDDDDPGDGDPDDGDPDDGGPGRSGGPATRDGDGPGDGGPATAAPPTRRPRRRRRAGPATAGRRAGPAASRPGRSAGRRRDRRSPDRPAGRRRR